MFTKILNKADCEKLKHNLKTNFRSYMFGSEQEADKVMQCIEYHIDILDENYGTDRKENDDGGFILLLSSLRNELSQEECSVVARYNLLLENAEFVDDVVLCGNMIWRCATFVSATEYNIVMIYPDLLTGGE